MSNNYQTLAERQGVFESINNVLSSIFEPPTPAQPSTSSQQQQSPPASTSSSRQPASTPTTTQQQPSTTQQQPTTTSEAPSTTREQPTTSTTPTTTRAPATTSSRETSTSTVITTPSTSRSTIVEQSTSGTQVVPVTRVITMTQPVVVVTNVPSDQNQSGSSSSSDGGKIGGIVGGVVGGLALLTLLGIIALLWRRRRARTGHGWFLCFGTRPGHGRGDPNDWPTFDPVEDGAVAGGGSRFGRKRKNAAQATLPAGFETADPESLGDGDGSSGEHMREYAAGAGLAGVAGAGAYAAYSNHSNGNSGYHAASQDALSGGHMSNAAPGSYGGPSDEGHFSLGQAGNGWGVAPPAGAALGAYRGAGSPPPALDTVGPDYGHLDPPEVREQRAREQQAAWAAAAAAQARSTSPALSGSHASGTAPQLPDVGRQSSMGSIGAVAARATSPPPPGYAAAGPSTGDAYGGMAGQDPYNMSESEKRGRLHLSNPDQ